MSSVTHAPERTIAVVGNPNSGKTTIFNGLTASRQRVGNWPGVTVEKKQGRMIIEAPSLSMVMGSHHGGVPTATREKTRGAPIGHGEGQTPRNNMHLDVIDLPGIYSLSAGSEDEIVARDFILSRQYDLVVSIVDAANLERNLYLTLQLIEMKVPVLVVLNMMDRAEAQGITVDPEHLATHLGCLVVPAVATSKDGIVAIRRAVEAALVEPTVASISILYPEAVEGVIDEWRPILEPVAQSIGVPARYIAVRLLEGDEYIEKRVEENGSLSRNDIDTVASRISKELREELDIVIADGRYGFIHGVSRDVIDRKLSRETITEKIDNVVMHRWLGVPIFLGAMYLVFWATIALGGAFIDFFDIFFGTIFVGGLGTVLESIGSPVWLTRILADGVGAGIQTVATFIPIIFMMFFMLSLLEDSGYMARAAFVMDRVMRLVGLPGKSFVPMLVGFGCTVPAISGTRTLETKKDRFMTIFMAPFMSCGARLPVYALFAAALFPGRSGLVVFSLYVSGIVLAVLTGILLKHTLFGSEYSHFVMELPTYHPPRLFSIVRSAGQRLLVFVKRAGITITMVVTVLALLNSLGTDGSFGNEDSENSVLSSIGRTVTPVFTPMGIEEDNWPATVGLFTGLFAKEAIVGTLSSLYAVNEGASETGETAERFDLWGGIGEAFATIPENLAGVLSALTDPFGFGLISDDQGFVAGELEVDNSLFDRMRSQFTAPGAYAYLLFVLIYFPCVAALGAAINEMGPGYGWLLAGYLTLLAWAVATIVYQVGSGPQIVPLGIAVGLLVAIVALFAALGRKSRELVA